MNYVLRNVRELRRVASLALIVAIWATANVAGSVRVQQASAHAWLFELPIERLLDIPTDFAGTDWSELKMDAGGIAPAPVRHTPDGDTLFVWTQPKSKPTARESIVHGR